MLRTRSPVYSPLRAFSLDLHVLGTPPAFVLSQDQTLQLKSIGASAPGLTSTTKFTQSIAVSAISASWTCYPVFKDRAYCHYGRPTALPRLATGRASYRCPRLVSKGFASALTHAPLLQGAPCVTPRAGGVKNLPKPPSSLAGTVRCSR